MPVEFQQQRRESRFQVVNQDLIRVEVRFEGVACANSKIFGISRSGCRLGFVQNLPVGSPLEITLQVECLDIALELTGVTRWSKPGTKTGWITGVYLYDHLPDEVMQQLAAEKIIERRQDTRQPSNVPVEARTQLNPEYADSTLVNFSAGGFCLETDREFVIEKPGARLMLRVKDVDGKAKTICARIVWHHIVNDRCMVGCKHVTREDQLTFSKIVHPGSRIQLEQNSSATKKTSWKAITAVVMLLLLQQVFELGFNHPGLVQRLNTQFGWLSPWLDAMRQSIFSLVS